MINIKRFLRVSIFGLGVVFGSTTSCSAQELKEMERIDSLTKELYGFSKDDCPNNFVIRESSSVSSAIYEAQMSSLGSSIEYLYNPYVQGQINHMSYSNCKYLKDVAQKTKTYFTLFEPILDKYGIPNELKYLAIIESGLQTQAVSRAGASGLWQFMPGTGKFLNMQVNSIIDERYHMRIATEKACEYLLRMYNDFGDWSLALAAYNAGPGNVRKAITSSGGKRSFWEIQRFLPGETKNYVPRFMATVYLMEFVVPEIMDECITDPKMIVQVNVHENVHLKHIASFLGVPIEEIINYNPMYRTHIISANLSGRALFLPYDLAMKFGEMETNIYTLAETAITTSIPTEIVSKIIYHKVKSGERMSSIASKYNVSTYEIKKWNRLNSTKIYSGKRLKIIQKQVVSSKLETNEGIYSYVIEKGETVSSICRKIPSLDKTYILSQNFIETDMEILEEGRIIEVHYGKALAEN